MRLRNLSDRESERDNERNTEKNKREITRRRKALRIGLILMVILLLGTFLASLRFASLVMTGTRQTLEQAMKWQSDRYDTSFYRTLEKDTYSVNGYGDYILHVELLKNPVPTDRYIILSHGYTDNRYGSLKYARMYLELGYHCILYDLRGHGENKRTFTTYGILESRDLVRLVEDTRSRYPDMKHLGLHGESLGAATTLTALKYQPQVDFVVADCGFSDIENVLRKGFEDAHVPAFIVDIADIGARLRYHYSLKKMRPIDALGDNEVPILFIHGDSDTFITPENSEAMSKRTKGISEFHLIEGAGHAESILTAPEIYKQYVSDFLARVVQ